MVTTISFILIHNFSLIFYFKLKIRVFFLQIIMCYSTGQNWNWKAEKKLCGPVLLTLSLESVWRSFTWQGSKAMGRYMKQGREGDIHRKRGAKKALAPSFQTILCYVTASLQILNTHSCFGFTNFGIQRVSTSTFLRGLDLSFPIYRLGSARPSDVWGTIQLSNILFYLVRVLFSLPLLPLGINYKF